MIWLRDPVVYYLKTDLNLSLRRKDFSSYPAGRHRNCKQKSLGNIQKQEFYFSARAIKSNGSYQMLLAMLERFLNMFEYSMIFSVMA